MPVIRIIAEGLGLGFLLYAVCAFGIRNGAVGMVFLYDEDVQNRVCELGLTSADNIKRNSLLFKGICVPAYIAYVLICVYGINKARGFFAGFLQMFAILSIMNLIDRFVIDDCWVGRTAAWVIPGTEDLQPYIKPADKKRKWIFGTVGMAVISAVLAAVMALIIR